MHNDFFLCVLQNAHSDELPPKPSKKKAVAADGKDKDAKAGKDGKKKDAAAKDKADKDPAGKKDAKEKKASTKKKKGAIDGDEEGVGAKKTRSKKGAKAATDAGQCACPPARAHS